MADEVWEDIEAALGTVVSTTDKSGNMKKELKNTISETVSTLRILLVKLKDISESKTKDLSDLSQCQFDHHKYHIVGSNPGLPRW
jgi:hypothetical protein